MSARPMTLTEAKAIADQPEAYDLALRRQAYRGLDRTRGNGGVRNSERAQERLERRLARLAPFWNGDMPS